MTISAINHQHLQSDGFCRMNEEPFGSEENNVPFPLHGAIIIDVRRSYARECERLHAILNQTRKDEYK